MIQVVAVKALAAGYRDLEYQGLVVDPDAHVGLGPVIERQAGGGKFGGQSQDLKCIVIVTVAQIHHQIHHTKAVSLISLAGKGADVTPVHVPGRMQRICEFAVADDLLVRVHHVLGTCDLCQKKNCHPGDDSVERRWQGSPQLKKSELSQR